MSKPLISDATLRGMYGTMQRLRAKELPSSTAPPRRKSGPTENAESEAVFAALCSQLHRRDAVLVEGQSGSLHTALAGWFAPGGSPAVHPVEADTEVCASVAAGFALRIADQAGAAVASTGGVRHLQQPVVIALLGSFPPLTHVLQLIEQQNLALLLFVRGAVEPRAEAQRRLLTTKVPIMPVDAADAVAVCRVTQECLLRARNGWGGAVIHAASMPPGADPVQLLRLHLEKRGITIP